MTINRYAPHVYVVPQDDRDRQIADGFVLHHQVKPNRVQVMPIAGGWWNVLRMFEDEYIQNLRRYPDAHLVMLIDFDGHIDDRRAEFQQAIPPDLEPRVFLVGAKDNPEQLKRSLKTSFEKIGESLAQDCDAGTTEHWDHEQLQHNDGERQRLVQTVRPFLF